MTETTEATTSRNEGKGQRNGRRLSVFKALLLAALVVVTGYGMLNYGLFGEERWIPVAAIILGMMFITLFVDGFYNDVPRIGWILVGLMAVLVAVKGLSMIWTVSPTETVEEMLRSSMYSVTFVLALAAAASKRLVGPFMDGLNLIALAVAVFGLLQKIDPIQYNTRTLDGVRIGSTLAYPNTVALIVCMGILLGLARMTQLRQPLLRGLYASALVVYSVALYFTFSRGAMVVLVLALLALFVLSSSRLQMFANLLLFSGPLAWLLWQAQGHEALFALRAARAERLADGAALRTDLIIALIGAFLFQAVYAALIDRYELVPNVRRALGIAAVAFTIVGSGLGVYWYATQLQDSRATFVEFTKGGQKIEGNADVSQRLTSSSSNSRGNYWSVAWEEWKEHPLTGTGAGTYHYTWLENRPNFSGVRQVHNVYLEQGTETGVVAFLALSGFAAVSGIYLMWAVWRARGERRLLLAGLTAAVGFYLVHSALEWHWYIPPSTLFFFILAGVALKYAGWEARDDEKDG